MIAYVAAQRTREIGILAALVSTRAMSALLFGVVPVDPIIALRSEL